MCTSMKDSDRCNICGVEMDNPDDPATINCGGDCVRCMAASGDPGCIQHLKEIEEDSDMVDVVRKQAFKDSNDGLGLVVCDWEDLEATKFSLEYIRMPYPDATLDFTDQWQADAVSRALYRAFSAGDSHAREELQTWLKHNTKLGG